MTAVKKIFYNRKKIMIIFATKHLFRRFLNKLLVVSYICGTLEKMTNE